MFKPAHFNVNTRLEKSYRGCWNPYSCLGKGTNLKKISTSHVFTTNQLEDARKRRIGVVGARMTLNEVTFLLHIWRGSCLKFLLLGQYVEYIG